MSILFVIPMTHLCVEVIYSRPAFSHLSRTVLFYLIRSREMALSPLVPRCFYRRAFGFYPICPCLFGRGIKASYLQSAVELYHSAFAASVPELLFESLCAHGLTLRECAES